jgi:hypothetical protein
VVLQLDTPSGSYGKLSLSSHVRKYGSKNICFKFTSLAYSMSKLTGINISLLSTVTHFIASLSVQISIESMEFIKFVCKYTERENIFAATEYTSPAKRIKTKPTARLQILAKSTLCQTHHRGHCSLLCISSYHSRQRQSLISKFSRSHDQCTRRLRSSVTDIGYYIRQIDYCMNIC